MIKLEGVSKAFGEHILFRGVTFEIKDGDFVIFSGASGCGKTTMLNMIGGIEPLSGGKITMEANNSVVIKEGYEMYNDVKKDYDYIHIRG